MFFLLLVRANMSWLPKRSSDTRTIHIPPRETVLRRPKPTAPGRGNARPRLTAPRLDCLSKFHRRCFWNLLTLIPEFSTGGLHYQAQGLFPASTFLEASRKFQRWLIPPRAQTISCLHVTKSFQNVLSGAHTPKTHGVNFLPTSY
jgi:hypothetical protein